MTAAKKKIINRSVLNFLLLKGIKFDEICSDGFSDMVKLLNPKYELPTSEEFENEVLPLCLEWFEKRKNAEAFIGIVTVHSTDFDDHTYLVALANTMSSKFVFICDACFDNYDQNLFKNCVINFFDETVVAANNFKNLTVHTLIYDCDLRLELEEMYNNDLQYFRQPSFLLLVQELENFVNLDLSQSSGEGDFPERVKDVCDSLKNPEMCVGHATEVILNEISTGIFFDDTAAIGIIMRYIGPFHMGCNFFLPEFQGNIATTDQLIQFKLDHMIYTFNPLALKFKNALEHVSHYKNKSEIFNYCFIKHASDPETFWTHAKQQFTELSNYALALLKLPAIPAKININDAVNFYRVITNIEGDRKDSKYAYVMSLKLKCDS